MPERVSKQVADYAIAQIDSPYVYGATAKACTPSYRRARIKQYPDYEDKIVRNCPVLSGRQSACDGCKYEGCIAHDCAQLTRYAAKAAGLTLPSGATSQWNKGDWESQGEIDTLPADKVAFVYRLSGGKMQHTGVYLGDGTVVDARGHEDGVVHKALTDYPWTHWGILRGMACPEELQEAETETRPTLRQGSKGEHVKELQRRLRELGYALEIDGKFGPLTRGAVMSYQGKAGLERDGVVGPLTWAALDAAQEGAAVTYTVTIAGLSEAVARQIVKEHGGKMIEEGGGGHE